ncbi:MAG TPA: YdcH family protein [Terriglobales bacterium]|nr:YdcH family protein [Terriglobales bacterium]
MFGNPEGIALDQIQDYSQLAAEHSSLDSQLQKLTQKRYLSADDEIEATRLKKLKLHVKDAMRQLQT